MVKQIRDLVIEKLWQNYSRSTPHVKLIEAGLQKKNIPLPRLDHLAIIDLPGPQTGISQLQKIFTAIGYKFQGKDYLPEKQNDFTWMADHACNGIAAQSALPQVVIADFRLDELPGAVKDIICKYNQLAPASPATFIEKLAQRDDPASRETLLKLIIEYLSGRDWPLPTMREFEMVRECNELLAWVLVFGRRPNHFTYSIHLMPEFKCLSDFHSFIEDEVGLTLNQDGGIIKGAPYTGIEQGSTAGTPEQIQLADGTAELPTGFVEFVWRFSEKKEPALWEDYFTGFVANHANRVIQSLYVHD